MDETTKLLHKEGCAPKLQIPIETIKKEDEIVGGVRLPQRLPISRTDKTAELPGSKVVKKEKRKKVQHFLNL